MQRRLVFAFVAFAALAPSRARADESVDAREPVSVTVNAPVGCTTEVDFVREVFSRTQRARVVGADDAERRFTVVIEAQRGAFRGTLSIVGKGGEKHQRVLMGKTCAALGSALALVTALTIDPQASTKPTAELIPAPAPPPAPAPAMLPPPDASPLPTEAVGAKTEPRPAPPPPSLPERAPKAGLAIGAFVGGGVVQGPLPDPSPALEVGALVAGREGLKSELRLMLATLLPDTTTVPSGGRARFNATHDELLACPLTLGTTWTLSPCATVSGGWVSATASEVPDAQSETRGTAAVGAALHGALRRGHLLAELGLAAGMALLRPRYYVDPNVDIFRTPGFVAAASVRIGAIMPAQD